MLRKIFFISLLLIGTIQCTQAMEYVKNFNGNKEWYQNNKLHRLDGPAIENVDGTKEWYYHGLRHREDGPAVEYANGRKV